jgi:sortase A
MKLSIRWICSPRRQVLRRIQNIFWALGCAIVGICALAYIRGAVFQYSEQRRFQKTISSSTKERPGPVGSNAPIPLRLHVTEGALLGRMEIPRLGLSVILVEGVRPRNLRLAVGHIPGTAFPDELGNLGLAGHRDTFFRELKQIRRGDLIIVRTIRGVTQYSVEWTRIVKPKNIDVLEASPVPVLTLVTCYPFYFVGPAPERFIVRAHSIGIPVGQSSATTQISENPGSLLSTM